MKNLLILLGIVFSLSFLDSCKKEEVEKIVTNTVHDTVYTGKANPVGTWNCYQTIYITSPTDKGTTYSRNPNWVLIFADTSFRENRGAGFLSYQVSYSTDKSYFKIRNSIQSWESCYVESYNSELRMTRIVDSLTNNKIIYYLKK